MIRSILLKGYYGFGNFGDDLLFLISWRWLRGHYPGAAIRVCTESTESSYLSALAGEQVDAVRNQDPATVDLLFHGGGGTYFDFKKGPALYGFLNRFARFLGPRLFRSLYQVIQAARGRHRVRGRIRIGVGLGIGTYTSTARRFPFEFVELSEFDLLVVRDPASKENARRIGIDSNLQVATDLAFLTRFWIPAHVPNRMPRTLGIVLRDWPYDHDAHLHAVREAVTRWQKAGYVLRFFSFDPVDRNYAREFAAQGEWIPWNPQTMSMEEFLMAIGSCEVVVSSRAHGVLTAACLGVPVVCLEIEPKLSAVADMVPQGIIRVPYPFEPSKLVQAVEDAARLETRRGHPENEEKVLAALRQVSELAPNS